jgi:hypothetical protein
MTLRQQLSQLNLPTGPIKLKPGETIQDVQKFISGHLEMVENSDYDEFRIEPYRSRLELLIEILTKT